MSDTTPRDQLVNLIEWAETDTYATSQPDGMARTTILATAILDAGWRPPARAVTTVEELDALPDGTVIRDVFGETWTLYEGLDDGIDPDDPTNYRWGIGLNGNFPTYVTDLPATVLWEPEEGE